MILAAAGRDWPLAAAAIGRDTLVRNPEALGQAAGLPEDVDRNAAARIPVAADAQELRLDLGGDPLADHHGAVLVESAMVAKACDIKFQRFRLEQPFSGCVVDHKMREIRLSGDWTDRCEFRHGE